MTTIAVKVLSLHERVYLPTTPSLHVNRQYIVRFMEVLSIYLRTVDGGKNTNGTSPLPQRHIIDFGIQFNQNSH